MAYYSGGKQEMTYKQLVDDLAKGVRQASHRPPLHTTGPYAESTSLPHTRHFLEHPSTRYKPELPSPSAILSPTAHLQPKERSPMVQTFLRKLRQTLLKRVSPIGRSSPAPHLSQALPPTLVGVSPWMSFRWHVPGARSSRSWSRCFSGSATARGPRWWACRPFAAPCSPWA